MPDYRKFVQRMANGPTPSKIFMNRNVEHAAVVMEFLFRKAENTMHIVSHRLDPAVYGLNLVREAAFDYLNTYPAARLDILSESNVVRDEHPLFQRLDRAGLSNRASLNFIPQAAQRSYKFNFAVADGRSYRYEEQRTTSEAIVQFGAPDFGGRLESTFQQLSRIANQDQV